MDYQNLPVASLINEALANPEKELQLLHTAWQRMPNEPAVLYYYGSALLKNKKYDQADNLIPRRHLARFASEWLYLLKARIAYTQFRRPDEYLTQAEALAPDNPLVITLRGEVQVREKLLEQAESSFKRALSIDPQCAPALNALASIEADIARAAEYSRKAAAYDPASEELHIKAGISAIEAKNYEEGILQLEIGWEDSPRQIKRAVWILIGYLRLRKPLEAIKWAQKIGASKQFITAEETFTLNGLPNYFPDNLKTEQLRQIEAGLNKALQRISKEESDKLNLLMQTFDVAKEVALTAPSNSITDFMPLTEQQEAEVLSRFDLTEEQLRGAVHPKASPFHFTLKTADADHLQVRFFRSLIDKQISLCLHSEKEMRARFSGEKIKGEYYEEAYGDDFDTARHHLLSMLAYLDMRYQAKRLHETPEEMLKRMMQGFQ